jgi:hypothetical protein
MGQEPATVEPGQEPVDDPKDPANNGQEPKTFDEAYVKELRAEAARHRKDAADAKKRAGELENEKLTETEKLKKDAEDGRKLGEAATGKLRSANLRDALAEKGFSGARAKAVARLLSGVEYDDEDEPKNLDARLKAAESEYGDIAKAGGSTGFDGGTRGSGDQPKDMNTLIRRAAGRA